MKRMLLISGLTVTFTALAWAFVTPPEWYDSPGLHYYKPGGPSYNFNLEQASDVYWGGGYRDIATWSTGQSFGVGNTHSSTPEGEADIIFNLHSDTGWRTLLSWQDHGPDEDQDGDTGRAVATLEWIDHLDEFRQVAVATGSVSEDGHVWAAAYIYDGCLGGDSEIGRPYENWLDERIYREEDPVIEGFGVDVATGLVNGEPYAFVLKTYNAGPSDANGYRISAHQIVRKNTSVPEYDYVLGSGWGDHETDPIIPKKVIYHEGYVYVCGTKAQYGNDFFVRKYDASDGTILATATKDFGAYPEDAHEDLLADATIIASDDSIVLFGTVNPSTNVAHKDFGLVQFSSSLTEMGSKQIFGSPNNGTDTAVAIKDFGYENSDDPVVIVAGTGPMINGKDYMFAKVPVSPLSTKIYVKGHGLSGDQTLFDMDVRISSPKRIFLSGQNGIYATSCEWEDEEDATPIVLSSHTGQNVGYAPGSPYNIPTNIPIVAWANEYCAGTDRLFVGGHIDGYGTPNVEGGAVMWVLEPE